MDSEELSERLHDLQVSLNDGEDLARASELIGDALERRMTSIRLRLEELKDGGEIPDGRRLDEIVDRVRATLDDYEDRLDTRRQRMQDLVDEFQDSLGEEVDQLEQLRSDLG